ncbi:MAG: hypothetical protein R6T99_05545 [Bacteroidales bacterium]
MKVSHLMTFFPVFVSLKKGVRVQQRYVSKALTPGLEEAWKTNDGTLDQKDLRKITHYYGMGVPAIVGEFIGTLRGYPMSETERRCSTYQGAITGLFDDFFDKTHLSGAQIRSMLNDPFHRTPQTSLEKVFLAFLQQIHRSTGNRELFMRQTQKVFHAQEQSKKQRLGSIDLKALKDISINKGGHSLLFYRSAFNHDWIGAEEKTLFEMGGVMQLGNDIFDVYEDSREGNRTIATAPKDIARTRALYYTQLARTLEHIDMLSIPRKRRRALRHKFLLAISRCEVCLDQLETLQKNNSNIFDPLSFSREALICDMQKTKNILGYIRYYLSGPSVSFQKRQPSP